MQKKFHRSAGAVAQPAVPEQKRIDRAVIWFLCCFGAILAVIAAANLFPAFSDFSLPGIALLYLIAGVGAGFWGGLRGREVAGTFLRGLGGVAPGILLILMAMSVSYIIERGGVMDTVVHYAAGLIAGASTYVAAYLMYALVLAVNFFIGSASPKRRCLSHPTPLADPHGWRGRRWYWHSALVPASPMSSTPPTGCC